MATSSKDLENKLPENVNDQVDDQTDDQPTEETPPEGTNYLDVIDDYDDEGEDIDLDQGESADEPQSEPEPTAEPAPPVTPQEPAQPTPEPAPQPQPAQPTEPAQPAPQPEPAQPQMTPEERQAAALQWRDNTINALASQHYALTEEEEASLRDDPSEFLVQQVPKLAARVYLDAVTAASQAVVNRLPDFLTRYNAAQGAEQAAEEQFFQTWPQLDRKTDRETVARFTQAYRNLNPNAPLDQAIQEIGASVMVALKRDPNAGAAPAAAPQPAPTQPQPGFKPAGAGRVGGLTPSKDISDMWMEAIPDDD